MVISQTRAPTSALTAKWADKVQHRNFELLSVEILGNQLALTECGSEREGKWLLTWHEDIRPTMHGKKAQDARKECWDGTGLNSNIGFWECHTQGGNQLFKYIPDKHQIFHVPSQGCATADKVNSHWWNFSHFYVLGDQKSRFEILQWRRRESKVVVGRAKRNSFGACEFKHARNRRTPRTWLFILSVSAFMPLIILYCSLIWAFCCWIYCRVVKCFLIGWYAMSFGLKLAVALYPSQWCAL